MHLPHMIVKVGNGRAFLKGLFLRKEILEFSSLAALSLRLPSTYNFSERRLEIPYTEDILSLASFLVHCYLLRAIRVSCVGLVATTYSTFQRNLSIPLKYRLRMWPGLVGSLEIWLRPVVTMQMRSNLPKIPRRNIIGVDEWRVAFVRLIATPAFLVFRSLASCISGIAGPSNRRARVFLCDFTSFRPFSWRRGIGWSSAKSR